LLWLWIFNRQNNIKFKLLCTTHWFPLCLQERAHLKFTQTRIHHLYHDFISFQKVQKRTFGLVPSPNLAFLELFQTSITPD
jgi:hypothetical protein